MKGLELSRKFYETYGAPMLHEKFPELEDKLAIGLVGDGSECFGYDDDISRDHDFEPGFCIFVPDDIDSNTPAVLNFSSNAPMRSSRRALRALTGSK